jgi:two-component system NtrC family sensor kinase
MPDAGIPLRVLLVEDDDDDAQLVLRELERGGYRVSAERVQTEPEMVRALGQGGWHAIVADWVLPAFSGEAALRLYRESGCEAPFFVVSGTLEEELAVEALRTGAKDFVTKGKLARLVPAIGRELRAVGERRSGATLRRLIERAPVATYLMTEDVPPHTLFMSPQFGRMSGFTLEELAADAGLFWRQIVPEDREQLEAQAEAGRGLASITSEFRVRRKDGSIIWWRTESQRIWDDAGQRSLRVGFILDVTERRQAVEEVRAQRQALRRSEKLAGMGRLLASVAHELNNPLAVALGQASLLQRELRESPSARRAGKIVGAVERAGRIVQSFLGLARKQPTSRQAVSVRKLVEGALEFVANAFALDEIGVDLALADDLPEVSGDPHQLQQALLSLLTNARQALQGFPGPRCVRLVGSHDRAADQVVLLVEDSGPGVSAAARPHLFEPFFTTRSQEEGTGLGLSICRSILESHGGRIEEIGTLGQGASFRLTLPVAQPGERVEAAPAPAEIGAEKQPTLHVLVVDDEPEIAEMLAEVLRDDGRRVDVARNGKEALRCMEQAAYDLVLTDLRMPGLDGPGLHAEVARRWPGREDRFVFITGDGLSADSGDFLDRTNARHLLKPFSLAELRNAVSEISRASASAAPSRPPTPGARAPGQDD